MHLKEALLEKLFRDLKGYVGLKKVGKEIKIVNATTKIVEKHYLDDKNWIRSADKNTIDTYEKYNLDIAEVLGTNNALKIDKLFRKWLIQHLSSTPVVVLIFSGNHDVEVVRKIVGTTVPFFCGIRITKG